MKSKNNHNKKIPKDNTEKQKKEMSLGDKLYVLFNIILVILILLYVDDKYKYEYTKNPKDIIVEATFIWLVFTIITYTIYELLKKIYYRIKSKITSKQKNNSDN